MDPVPFFDLGLMVGSVGILLSQAFGRRRALDQGNRTRK
jgi:hypothetical protein